MSLEQSVNDLVTATTDLLDTVNVSKQTLDDAKDAAQLSASNALNSELDAESARDAAIDARNAAQLAQTGAEQARDDAVAVVYDGDASLVPAAGKIPVADGNGHIDHEWIPKIQQKDILSSVTAGADFINNEYKVYSETGFGEEVSDVVSYTRGSVATYEAPTGVLKTATIDVLRPAWQGGIPLGAMSEGQATNLLVWSEDFTQANWTKTLVSVVPSAARAPDGTLTASKLIPDTTLSSLHLIEQTPSGTAVGEVRELYVKAAEYSKIFIARYRDTGVYNNTARIFDTITGEWLPGQTGPIEVNPEYVGDGWWRISLAFASGTSRRFLIGVADESLTVSPAVFPAFAGDGTSGLYIWGAQLETGSAPSSYIKTEGSQATRQASSLSFSPLGTDWQGTSGTFYLKTNNSRNAKFLYEPTANVPLLENVTGSGNIIVTYDYLNNGAIYVDGILAYSFVPQNGINLQSLVSMLIGSGNFNLEKSFYFPRILSGLEIAQIQGAF